jgi:hypothetical protein
MLVAVAAGTLAPTAPARAEARDESLTYVMLDAQRDFDAVRKEAALSGSAPLVGMKAEKQPAKKGKAARVRAEAKDDAKHVTALDPKPAAVGQP